MKNGWKSQRHRGEWEDVCPSDEDIEIISGYWEGLKSENKRLRDRLYEPEKPVDDCSGNWDEEGEHDD